MKPVTLRRVLRVGENMMAHAAALVIGLVLMVVGIGMGVTVLALPIGIPVGITGLGFFLWGGWGFGEAKRRGREE